MGVNITQRRQRLRVVGQTREPVNTHFHFSDHPEFLPNNPETENLKPKIAFVSQWFASQLGAGWRRALKR